MFPLTSNAPLDFFNMTASDLAIVLLMIAVFVLALVLPYPRRRPPKGGQP